MIRINLIPAKRKAKARPVPVFGLSAVAGTLLTAGILAYIYFYFDSTLMAAKARFEDNKQNIAGLKNKIREVDDFEKINKTFSERNSLIEQLRKKQNTPVMTLDSIDASLPNGVWLNLMGVSGDIVNIDGYAFTNSDVVAFVDNLKLARFFSDVSLLESRETEVEKILLYKFRLTLKVAI